MKLKSPIITLAYALPILFSFAIRCMAHDAKAPEPEDSAAIANRYEMLAEVAVRGDHEAQVDAFVHVYQHASQLREHVPEAIEFLVQSAAAGNVDAQYNLGFLLQTGTWVDQDEEEALPWLLLAAQKGHLAAQLWSGINLANKHYRASVDSERQSYFLNAVHWLKKVNNAAQPGTAEKDVAMVALGRIYFSQPQTRDEGISLLRAAAETGYTPAMDALEDLADLIEEWEQVRKEVHRNTKKGGPPKEQ